MIIGLVYAAVVALNLSEGDSAPKALLLGLIPIAVFLAVRWIARRTGYG
jgi:hypothetical protein